MLLFICFACLCMYLCSLCAFSCFRHRLLKGYLNMKVQYPCYIVGYIDMLEAHSKTKFANKLFFNGIVDGNTL
jgi:hypothetical protein